MVQSVATISAGNDEMIGSMIAEALDKVGADGVLSIETSNSLETTRYMHTSPLTHSVYLYSRLLGTIAQMPVQAIWAMLQSCL